MTCTPSRTNDGVMLAAPPIPGLHFGGNESKHREAHVEPEDVLELIRSAPERYETVRAALRYRGDGPTIKTVRERFWYSEAGRHTFGVLREREAYDPSEEPEPDGPFGWRCRIWHVDRHRWRQELELW